jgi:hypothetical protein
MIYALTIASVLALGLIALSLLFGASVPAVEKVMVWVSVPWFAYWYLTCRKLRGRTVKESEEQ